LDILYVMRNIWGGGAPRRFWEIHRLLISTKGLNVNLLATPDASTYQRFEAKNFPGIKIIPLRIPKSPLSDYLFYFKAAKIVKAIAKDFDVVHDDFSPMAPYSFFWCSNTVATVQEVFGGNAIRRYGVAGLILLINESLYHRMGYKTFVTPSPSTAKELKKLGVNSVIIPNGVHTEIFKPNPNLRNQNDIVICMVSRFVPVKGHIFFLKIAKQLSRKYKNIKFILPSTGPLLPKMRVLANELNLPVKFTGFLESEKDIVRILQGSDIYVHTSLQEGFGISVCEAMACRLPIVAFNVLGVRNLVTPECGFLTPVGDVNQMVTKIKALIENESLRKEMGRRARERVLKYFTWQRAADRMLEVYRNVQ